jgi:hypothetical protein
MTRLEITHFDEWSKDLGAMIRDTLVNGDAHRSSEQPRTGIRSHP